MPIYVAADSVMWMTPHYFKTSRSPMKIAAGCPVLTLSAGNPIYNWEAMKADGYVLTYEEASSCSGLTAVTERLFGDTAINGDGSE